MSTHSRRTRQGSISSTGSVYSTATLPSISRRSSEYSSDQLEDPGTPLQEDFPLHVPQGSKTHSSHSQDKEYGQDGHDIPHAKSDFTVNSSSTVRLSSKRGPYSFIQESRTPPPSLEYRHSTRELVSRYEAISGAQLTRSIASPLESPHFPAERLNSDLPELPGSGKPKGQTFSLRNFLTVFSSKKSKSPQISQQRNSPITPENEDISLISNHLHDFGNPLSASFAFRTGPALYLSYATFPPLWHPCSLTLYPSHLALTYSQDARHITQTIPLLFCVDVHSLTAHQLGNDVPKPTTPTDAGHETDKEIHVFEMMFEGYEPTKERLAAWSAAERGRWVSATWDVILACRDPNAPRHNLLRVAPSSNSYDDVSRGSPLMVVNHTGQISSSSSSPSASAPLPNTRQHIPQDVPSQTSTLTQRRRSPLSGPSSASNMPPSPSIQTLGSMSIVRQRLAKLDGQQSSLSNDSLSTSSSICSKSYGVSSRKHREMTANQDNRYEMSDHPSESSKQLARNTSATSRLSHFLPETPFTALDAHSMYHEPLPNVLGMDVVNITGIPQVGGPRPEAHGNFSNGEVMPYHKQPETWDKNIDPRNSSSPNEAYVRAEFDAKRLEGTRDRMSKSQRQVVEHGGTHYPIKPVHLNTTVAGQLPQASDTAEGLVLADGDVRSVTTKLSQDTGDLDAIHAKLDRIMRGMNTSNLNTMHQLVEARGQTSRSDHSLALFAKLDELHSGIKEDLPQLSRGIDNLENPLAPHTDMTKVLLKLEEIKGVMDGQRTRSSAALDIGAASVVDMSDIHSKLDGLVGLCTALIDQSKVSISEAEGQPENEVIMNNVTRAKDSSSGMRNDGSGPVLSSEEENPPSIVNNVSQITQLLDVIKGNETGRALQAQQQAESVQYLNELNSWLESFVANSMGQMQQVSSGVDQLCKEWLPVAEARVPTGFPNVPGGDSSLLPSPSNNIFADLQHFLAERELQSQETRTLQATLNSLTEMLREDMEKNSHTRIEVARQAQAQENLLNGFARALADEIRGERLRFVEAMKEATSVNVDLHVEEVKQVLAGLHQKKKILEQQVAELFSFVGNQRQGIMASRPVIHETLEVPQASRPKRPLPQIKYQY